MRKNIIITGAAALVVGATAGLGVGLSPTVQSATMKDPGPIGEIQIRETQIQRIADGEIERAFDMHWDTPRHSARYNREGLRMMVGENSNVAFMSDSRPNHYRFFLAPDEVPDAGAEVKVEKSPSSALDAPELEDEDRWAVTKWPEGVGNE